MTQMDELPEQQECKGDDERHDRDVCGSGDAGHEDQRRGEQPLRLVAPIRRLHWLIRGDEQNQMRRCGDRTS